MTSTPHPAMPEDDDFLAAEYVLGVLDLAERSAVGARVLRNATAMTRVAILRNPVLRGLRNLAVRGLSGLPAVQRRFAAAMSETDIHYPASPLNHVAPGLGGGGRLKPGDHEGLLEATAALMEKRLSAIGRTAPAFAAALRAYRRALADGETEMAEGLVAWIAGQPNVAANIARRGIRRVGAWATSACLNSPAPVDGFIAALLASRSRERLIATLSPEMALRTGCARASQTKPATPSATVYTGAIVATWIR